MDHLYSLSLFQYSTLRQKNQLNYAQILPLDQKDDFFAFSSQSLAKVNLKSDEMPFCRRREGHLVPQGAELKEYIVILRCLYINQIPVKDLYMLYCQKKITLWS